MKRGIGIDFSGKKVDCQRSRRNNVEIPQRNMFRDLKPHHDETGKRAHKHARLQEIECRYIVLNKLNHIRNYMLHGMYNGFQLVGNSISTYFQRLVRTSFHRKRC